MTHQFRPENWKALAPQIPNFAHQPTILPRLPVPSLEATLRRLKDSLRPLARSAEEFASLCHKIDDFGHPDGIGPLLQQFLLQRKIEKDNYLEGGWDDIAFLSCRDPLAINVSPYCAFEPQPAHLPQESAARAAGLTFAVMALRHKLRSGRLPPDTVKNVELCMDNYRWLFDSFRVPGAQGIDWSISYAGSPNPHDELGHVIVIRKNRFWRIKAQVGDDVVGMGDLIRQFQYIYDQTTDEYPAIGALTSITRDDWAEDFELLSSVPSNATIFREIHSSAFIVSLDDSTPPPESDVDVMRALWYGTLHSSANPTGVSRGLSARYFDKPIQLVVFDNSIAGMVVEHSVIDGTVCLRLCDEFLGFLSDPNSDLQLSTSPAVTSTPEPLDFDLTSIPEAYSSIAKAQVFLHDLASSKSLSLVRTLYGKSTIKAFGIGPDAWAQMIVQLAYARLSARFNGDNSPVLPWPVPTFEVVLTRKFYKSRWECFSVISDECVSFVRSMLKNTAVREEKAGLFRDAVKKHQHLVSEAARGEGVYHHMAALGLSQPTYESMAAPALFTDPLYTRAREVVLDTSSIFSSHAMLAGSVPSFASGKRFGIFYQAGFDDYLQFTITSDRESPNDAFAGDVGRASEELYELLSGFSQTDANVGNSGNDAQCETLVP